MDSANFRINGRKAFRINFCVLIFVCLCAWIMPHPLISHSFNGVFNHCRASVDMGPLGSGRESKSWNFRYNFVALSRFSHRRFPIQNLMQLKFRIQKFSQFLFLYGETLYKVYENLHRSKISHYMYTVNVLLHRLVVFVLLMLGFSLQGRGNEGVSVMEKICSFVPRGAKEGSA